ncbi:MAG: TRL-like family protein [Candidatus Amulumruptor caecigallinarius]|nr:TRL-like family protein [Candidatus Amulumruptor caecigallinarius]MCM1396371.1 TRL-like family protein [Candidatus Amulumruptor caecigallinarius]MCM1453687.1 TRL-like family protein [bacterium]
MKKFFKLACASCLLLGMASCSSTTPITATSNPVGNKCGVAKTSRVLTIFGGSADCGINKAAKNGGITRISHVDAFEKSYLGIYSVYGVRVYGE